MPNPSNDGPASNDTQKPGRKKPRLVGKTNYDAQAIAMATKLIKKGRASELLTKEY